MNKTYKKSCEGKRQYSNRDHAQKEIERGIKQSPSMRDLWVYECPHCKKWHMGHPPGFEKRRKALLEMLGMDYEPFEI